MSPTPIHPPTHHPQWFLHVLAYMLSSTHPCRVLEAGSCMVLQTGTQPPQAFVLCILPASSEHRHGLATPGGTVFALCVSEYALKTYKQ